MNITLKVALIVDGERLSSHNYELVKWANSSGLMQVSHLIVQERDRPTRKRPLRLRLLRASPRAVARALLWKLKDWIEARHVAANACYRDADRSFEVGEIVPGRIFVRPQVSKSGLVYRFAEEDLEKIRRERFDILIRCGSGILRGRILTSARLGILSFHHGDNRINRGGPPAFWEVYYGWSKTGFIVQRLTEELDGGEVLLRGFVPTQATHLQNRALLYAKSYGHLRGLLRRIAQTGELPPAESHVPYSGRLYVAPRARELAAYLIKRAARNAADRARKSLSRRERWGVCFLKSDWPTAALWRGKRIETPAGRFLADPFVATRDGRTCVFVEDYVYSTAKAHISVYEIGGSSVRELGIAIDEPFHLSFPYLFEYQGDLFMCPESSAAGQVRIYRCVRFPLEWTLERIVMKDVSAADTMIFPHGGRWWLFTNLCETQPEEHSSELHIFSAADPLGSPWQPHPRNPVIIDPERGRNAGLLRERDGFVRVCQCQGFRSYGASARLMRIVRLDEHDYREEQVCQLAADFIPGAHGTHHLHSDGIYSVWDYKRRERVTLTPQPPSNPTRELTEDYDARIQASRNP